MLCSLGGFIFESNNVNLEEVSEDYTYPYEQTETINDWDEFQSTGRYQRTSTLSGLLIKKSPYALELLLAIAARKKDITLAYDSGIAHRVVILAINTNKSLFLRDGTHLKQDFSVNLGFING